MQRLTEKQELFCHHYIMNGYNGTQAAISAGYSEKIAAGQAYQNLRLPHILERIKEMQRDTVNALCISKEKYLAMLNEMAEKEADPRVRLEAIKTVADWSGYKAPEKKDIVVNQISEQTKKKLQELADE